MISHTYAAAAAAAAAACALAVTSFGTAHAAAPDPGGKAGASNEIDRNLIKPPPGGVLAPVADAAGKILPR
ncbi:hypothetical protein OG317_23780 [Streptomyces sp. NBC_01167]|uniref:hypothetical protein n=1 Tax=Streptomyces sp. NBC_01167 TaxID=2903756 RepID=UPI0038660BBE|nr:hypothetical protein OG317_23780 [Streptomyces sp. NBC_01167]